MYLSGQPIEIPLSKSKIILLLFGALTFVGIGLWFVIDPPTIQNSYWGNPTKIAFAGYASIIFFGLCAYFFISKLADKKPGLIINHSGIVDNSSGLSAGLIQWSDIEDITVVVVHRQKLIMVHVKNPQEFINRQTSFLKRKGMEYNYKMYGTPLSITTNGLKTSFDNLLNLLTEKFQASQT